MSYAGLSEDVYAFEVMSVGSDFEWVGLGFSEDPYMPDTNVVICTADAVEANYNPDYSGPVLLTDPTYGIGNPSPQVIGDTLYCSFTRPATMSFPIPPDDTDVLEQDLNSESYFVLLASGELNGDGRPDIHSVFGNSTDPVDFTMYNDFVDGGDSNSFYSDCGQTKGCVGLPEGCVSSQSCQVLNLLQKKKAEFFCIFSFTSLL